MYGIRIFWKCFAASYPLEAPEILCWGLEDKHASVGNINHRKSCASSRTKKSLRAIGGLWVWVVRLVFLINVPQEQAAF